MIKLFRVTVLLFLALPAMAQRPIEFGPLDWDEQSDQEYFRRLGIARLPPAGEEHSYFRSIGQMSGEQTDFKKKCYEQYIDVNGPWQDADYPELAKWLRTADQTLDHFITGSHSTR